MSDSRVTQCVTLGVDVGGTKIAAGLVDATGEVMHAIRLKTRPDALLPDILACCKDLVAHAATAGAKIAGIGVGAKGTVDRQSRQLLHSLYLGSGVIRVGEELEAALGVPVWLENDVHAAAIGEMIFGVGRTCEDFIFFNAGTGISVGIVSKGRLYRGATGVAGEIGHVSMDGSGQFPCKCGLSGCLETMIIREREGHELPRPKLNLAETTLGGAGYEFIAMSAIDLINLLRPKKLVLAGGMFEGSSDVAGKLRAIMTNNALLQALESLDDVVCAYGGRMAGVIGSAALPLTKGRNQSSVRG
jgi:glucokinase